MNLEKILFPTDFSKNSHAGLDYATALARDMNARLLILHVAEPVASPAAVGEYYGVPQPDAQELQTVLKSIVPADPDVAFEHHLSHGVAAETICDVAEEQNVDLIVMGTHGRTGLPRLLMGSVAELVMRHAPCPVLTVKLRESTSE